MAKPSLQTLHEVLVQYLQLAIGQGVTEEGLAVAK
jgi:hypothetical protein